MEVVRLEKLGPKLSLCQLIRHIFGILFLNSRISFENALDNIRCDVVFQPVTSVSLWLNVGQKSTGHSYKNLITTNLKHTHTRSLPTDFLRLLLALLRIL